MYKIRSYFVTLLVLDNVSDAVIVSETMFLATDVLLLNNYIRLTDKGNCSNAFTVWINRQIWLRMCLHPCCH